MALKIPFHVLSEFTGIHADMKYGGFIDRDDFVQVNLDGTVEADLPGGWSVIEWATNPFAYPAALSGTLEYYEEPRLPSWGPDAGDIWDDVIGPLLSPNERNLPENLGRGGRFVHARHLFYRDEDGHWQWAASAV
jgi:hypothetical protein